MKKKTRQNFYMWFVPIALFLAITPFTQKLDLGVANWAFSEDFPSNFTVNSILDFFSHWGMYPARVICILSILFLCMSIFITTSKQSQKIAWILSLNLILGLGVVTHGILKEFWGRPRPEAILQFGGKEQFRPYYAPILSPKNDLFASFPSGHAVSGFYFLSFFFIGRRLKNRLIQYSGLALGLFFGTVLSLVRIMQGEHFISDTLFSALLMWLLPFFLDKLFFESTIFQRKSNEKPD